MPRPRKAQTTAPPRLRFAIPPEPSHLLRARERLRDYLRQYCAEPDAIDDVVQCVEEACTNAIRHSGSLDDVEIALRFTRTRLIATVSDRGRGFDVATFDPGVVPDPTADHGRGLFIMADLMDGFELRSDGGLQVTMTKATELRSESEEAGTAEMRYGAHFDHREARIRAMLEEIDEGFVALDWEYRYVYLNRPACQMLGRSCDELLGHKPFALFPKLHGSPLERAFREAMELGTPTTLEWRSPVIDAWVETRIYPTITGITVYFRDVGVRKRKESERDAYLAALRESEQRLRFHLENTPMAVVEWDARFIVTRWAGEAERMFGWSEAETVGRPIMDLNIIYEPDIPIVEATMAKLTDGVSRHVVSANRNYTKDGRVIDCTWHNSVLLGEDGEMSSVMSLVLDETARKRAEAMTEAQRRVLEGVNSILEAALTGGTEEELGVVCLKVAERITESKFGFIGEVGANGLLHDVAISDPGWRQCAMEDQSGHRRPPGNFIPHGLYGRVLHDGRSLVANDPSSHPDSIGTPSGHPVLTAFLGVPLQRDGRAAGMIAVANREGGYSVLEREALEGLAPAIVQAFERKRAEDRRKRADDEREQLVGELSRTSERVDFLADVVEKAAVPFGVGAPDGRLIFFNQAFAELTGFSREELEERALTWASDLTPEEWREAEAGHLATAVAERHPVRYEKEYVRKDGTRVPIELFVQPVFDGAGGLLHYRSFLADISERKQAEETLRESEERFRLALRNAPVSVSAQDTGLRYVWAFNQRSARPAEIIGRLDAEIFTAEEAEKLTAIKRRVMAEDVEISEQMWLDRPSGRMFLEVNFEPVHDRAGRVVGVGTTTVDLTPMKLVEEALRESEERFHSLYEAMTEGVVLHELIYEADRAVDYRILDANPAFARQTGLVVAEARGRLASELYGSDAAPYLEEYTRVVETGEPYAFETYFRPMERHFRITAVSPAPGRFATIFEDVTVQKRSESERERLVADLQTQSEELQVRNEELLAQGEELQAQSEELQTQSEELQGQADELHEQAVDLTRRNDLAQALNAIDGLIHSTRDLDQIMQRALDEGVAVLATEAGAIEVRENGHWVVRYQHGFTGRAVGTCLTDDEAPNAARAARMLEAFAVADMRGTAADVGFVRSHRLRSALAVPLSVQNAATGCLLFYGKTVRRFDEAEIDFVRKLGAAVSLAIENSRLYAQQEQLRRAAQGRADEMAVLKEIAEAAASSLDLRAVAAGIVDSVHRLLGARQVQIRLLDPDRSVLEPAASIDPSGTLDRLGSIPVDSDMETALCYRSKEPALSEDIGTATVSQASRKNAGDAGVRSYVLLPLIAGGEAVGTFYVAWAEPRRIEAEELSFLEAVAAESAAGLENARLYDVERRAQRRATLELETTSLLLAAAASTVTWTDLEQVLGDLADLLVRSTDHVRILVELWHEETREVEIAVSRGPAATPRRRFPFDAISEGAKEAITTRKTVVIDYGETVVPDTLEGFVHEHRFVLTLVVPVTYRGRLVGLFIVDQPGERRPFSPQEIDLVEAIAGHAGAAIENARLLQSERRAREIAAERTAQLEVINEIASIATASVSVTETAERVLDSLAARFGFVGAHVLLADEGRGELIPVAACGLSPDPSAGLPRIALDGETTSALAFRTGEPVVVGDTERASVGDESRLAARKAEALTGLRAKSWLILPLVGYHGALGTLNLYWPEARTFSEQELAFRTMVAHEIAIGLESARLREAAELELSRTAFLSEVAAAASSSLDVTELALRALDAARRFTGAIAGMVYTLDREASVLHAVATVGPDELVAPFRTTPLDEGYVMARVVLRGVILTHENDEPSPEALRRAAGTGIAEMGRIFVPIKVGGEVSAGFVLVFPVRRPFSEQDLDLYRAIADQLGTAIQNARLFEEQRRIAETLQESFIHPMPEVAGLELGMVAKTAFEPELVGGDFGDVFMIDDTHVAIVVGDVAGKGVRAAGLTETVRTKIRALAAIDASPAFVLRKTNELLLRYEPDEPHITAFLAVVDPRTGHVTYASAGHPAPVHLGAYTSRLLDVPFGLPLGSLDREYTNGYANLTLEDYLVLYTDGVTEARGGDGLFGEQRLLEVVSQLRGSSAQSVAEGVRDAALAFAGRLRDDLQVVVLRLA